MVYSKHCISYNSMLYATYSSLKWLLISPSAKYGTKLAVFLLFCIPAVHFSSVIFGVSILQQTVCKLCELSWNFNSAKCSPGVLVCDGQWKCGSLQWWLCLRQPMQILSLKHAEGWRPTYMGPVKWIFFWASKINSFNNQIHFVLVKPLFFSSYLTPCSLKFNFDLVCSLTI